MIRLKLWLINIISLNLLLLDISLKKIFSSSDKGEYFIFGPPGQAGDWLKLKLSTNSGVAFGWHLNYYLIILLYFIIIPILLVILLRQYKLKNDLNILGLTWIIFGSISNLIDRLFFGAVVDYLDLKYYSVFNLADVMIVLGVIIILLTGFLKKRST